MVDNSNSSPPVPISRLLTWCTIFYLVIGAAIFGFAGRWDLPWAWAVMAVLIPSHLTAGFFLRYDPELVRERLKPPPGAPLWDKILLCLFTLIFLSNLVLVPLDIGRYRWTDPIGVSVRMAGLVLLPLGMALTTWAMCVNTFFSKVVRLQEERGHRVIQNGPYRLVRHPGYVGISAMWLGFNLGLGSWLGAGLGGLLIVLLLYRTVREDRFLYEVLEGYPEYAEKVRSRWVPWIW